MENIIKILHEGNYSCVISNSEIRTFSQKGVGDLYDLLKKEPCFLDGASIADKIIGKGAATLMVLGKVKEVYTDIISSPALTLLQESGIEPIYEKVVPYIQNRDQTDWCPLEKICNIDESAENILPLIESFIIKMRANRPHQSVSKE